MNRLKPLFFFLALLIGISSCSKFEKFRKTATVDQKYKAAMSYYKKKEYGKAGLLFDEILPLMKGDSTQEMATFYQAYCDFQLENYQLASTHFKKFAEIFSRSEKVEEAIYMSAFSLYKDSPRFNLDQAPTLSAINEIQSYINTYPETKFKEECNNMIRELRKKLELKAYEKAKLYFKTSPFNVANLRAAVIEIANFQKEFPDSDFSEEIAYLKVLSQFELAKSTIFEKQRERFTDAGKFYLELLDKYPNSVHLKDAEEMYSKSQVEIAKIAKIEEEYKAAIEKEKSNTSKVSASPQ